MTDLKTTQEITRSPVDGTELVRLATPGNNWQASINSIFAKRAFGGGFPIVPLDGGSSYVQIQGDVSSFIWQQTCMAYGNNTRGSYMGFAKTRGTNPSTHVAVQNADILGAINWYGSDGTDYFNGVSMQIHVDGPVSAGAVPMNWALFTGPSTDNPTERFRIDSNGATMIGGGPSQGSYHGYPATLQVNFAGGAGFTAGGPTAQIVSFGSASDVDPQLIMAFSRGTTMGSHVIVGAGDVLGEIDWIGSDGTAFREAAEIWGMADAAPAAGSMPGRLEFLTSPTGSFTPAERMRIDSAGHITVGGFANTSVNGQQSYFQVAFSDGSYATTYLQYGNTGNDPSLAFVKTRGATPSTHGAVINSEWLGEIDFVASDGTTWRTTAFINAVVNGTVATGSVPTDLTFRTGQPTVQERMRIDSAGVVSISSGGRLRLGTTAASSPVNGDTWYDGSNLKFQNGGFSDTVVMLEVSEQPLSGGFTITSSNQGTKSSGTYTVDPGICPLQYITNNGAFTLAAPTNDGNCMILVTNGASAGTITFSGFSLPSSPGDALDTVSGHRFTLSIWRVNGVSGYRAAAMQ